MLVELPRFHEGGLRGCPRDRVVELASVAMMMHSH
jgi:hypothetical protein